MTQDFQETDEALLEVEDLHTHFGRGNNPIRAVDGVSFRIHERETVALVGESGSGKSVTALSLARLVPQPGFHPTGKILFRGADVLSMSDRDLRSLRGGNIAYVFQEPESSLNPVLRVGYQIMEAVRLHGENGSAADHTKETIRLMHMVGLPDPVHRMKSYPHERCPARNRSYQTVSTACCSSSDPRMPSCLMVSSRTGPC